MIMSTWHFHMILQYVYEPRALDQELVFLSLLLKYEKNTKS
jgi:hypothetical protein